MKTAVVVTALLLVAAGTTTADTQQRPTRGGLTIDQWRKSANTHARWVRKLRQANRQRLPKLGAHGVARGLLCIKQFEGSWTDPNPPYWGGLQMDMSFQRAYGHTFLNALGTANRWPAFVQLAVALEAYYRGRGYGPWPNTRRQCGL